MVYNLLDRKVMILNSWVRLFNPPANNMTIKQMLLRANALTMWFFSQYEYDNDSTLLGASYRVSLLKF